MTQASERKQWADQIKAAVCRVLNWDELQYAEFQYKIGCQYLQYYIPNAPEGIDELLRNRIYWNWWKNRWVDRDYSYLANPWLGNSDLSSNDFFWVYQVYHDAEVLAMEITMPGSILGQSYANMIRDIIKAEVA